VFAAAVAPASVVKCLYQPVFIDSVAPAVWKNWTYCYNSGDTTIGKGHAVIFDEFAKVDYSVARYILNHPIRR